MLAVGGWLGGTIVFHYGMRVLNLVEEPASRATSPIPRPEEEAGGGGSSRDELTSERSRAPLGCAPTATCGRLAVAWKRIIVGIDAIP